MTDRTKIIARRIYKCAFGPEDNSENLPSDKSSAPLSKGERRKNIEYGQSIKVGCQASFTIVVHRDFPDVCEIRYTSEGIEHSNKAGVICHGPGCKDPGLAQLAPRLSASVKQHATTLLLSGVRPSNIIKDIHKSHQRAYMIEHGLPSLDAAAVEMSVSPLVPSVINVQGQ